jgi:hypothetical protein
MLDVFERFAVFWVPARSDALARFGSSWMGWCSENGEPRTRHAAEGLTVDFAAATRQIWHHGFHGVIRVPFRLRPGRSRWAVEHALQSAADELAPVPLARLSLAVIGGRVALVPESPPPALARLLDRIEQALAPLAADPGLGARQTGAKAASGDAQVRQLPAGAAHRFHLPMTDRMELGAAFRVRDELAPRIEPLLAQPRTLGDLALMGDPGNGRPFRVLNRLELHEASQRGQRSVMPVSGPETLVGEPGGDPFTPGIAV